MDMQDAERIKELIVDPVVDALKAEMAPLKKKVEEHEARLASVEGNQKKAIAVFGGLAGAVTLAWNMGGEWIKKKLGI